MFFYLFFDSLGIETDVHLPTFFSFPQMCLPWSEENQGELSVSTERKGRALIGPLSFVGSVPGGGQGLPGLFSQREFHFALEVG